MLTHVVGCLQPPGPIPYESVSLGINQLKAYMGDGRGGQNTTK